MCAGLKTRKQYFICKKSLGMLPHVLKTISPVCCNRKCILVVPNVYVIYLVHTIDSHVEKYMNLSN